MAIYFNDKLVAGSGGTPDALPLAGGTMTGAINMDGNKVTGLPAPTADLDAVTKAYLDNAIATAVADYLAKAGGSMTGAINMGGNKITTLGNPTAASDAATKSYVDSAVPSGTFLQTSGGTMSGDINMGGNFLHNVGEVPISSEYNSYAIPISQLQKLYFSRQGLNVMQSGATIDMGANRVRNVGAPSAGTDAATKNYVDNNSLSIFIGTYSGTGETQTISFQKLPKFIVIYEDGAVFSSSYGLAPFAFATQQYWFGRVKLNGLNLQITGSGASDGGVNLNGRSYCYVAFM